MGQSPKQCERGTLRGPRSFAAPFKHLSDVEFKDDLSRYRSGHGAKNMAIVRRFALGLVRANNKRSVKSAYIENRMVPDILISTR
jgi:hypothetical protein